MIKTEVSASFPRGSEEMARRVFDSINEQTNGQIPATLKESVPHGTLTSWVKKQKESGKTIDDEKIGVSQGRMVKVKVRK